MAERPSVSEILARVRNTPSEPSTPAETPAPKPSESSPEPEPSSGNRPLSAADKIAAIRARSSGGAGPAPKPKASEPASKPAAEADRPLSAAEKVAAIRARAAQKKTGSEAPKPREPDSPPAKPEAPAEAPVVSPRPTGNSGWLGWMAAGVVLILAVGFWAANSAAPGAPAVVVFDPPKAGSVDDSRAADAGVFLIHGPLPDGSDGFYALSARCTFLDCGLRWNASESRFECPCHGCSYDLQGQPIAGPAPAPLPRLSVSRTSDGRVRVDRLQEVESPSSGPPGAIP